MKRFLIPALVLLSFSAVAYAGGVMPVPPGVTAMQRTHQVQLRIEPVLGPDGNQVLQVTLGYTRSAATEGLDQIIVATVGTPSRQVLMRLVDPRTSGGAKFQAMAAKRHDNALATAFTPLDELTHTAVVPYTPGVEEHLLVAARRGNHTIVLARSKANLTHRFTITARTTLPMERDQDESAPRLRNKVEPQTIYCYESDWCQEHCEQCNSEPCWDDYYCTVTCLDPPSGGGGNEDDCWEWGWCDELDY